MSDLLERLEARAAPPGPSTFHALAYNYPLAWYRTPNKDIVQLQSDPNNRAMYEDLGFVLLRPAEAREWETEVRPEVIAEQKKKAQLINAIRQMADRHPQVILTDEENLGFSDPETSIEYLEDYFRQTCEEFGIKPPRLRPIPPEKAAPADAKVAGVEMHGGGELEGKLQRGQGYDPMKEARRR